MTPALKRKLFMLLVIGMIFCVVGTLNYSGVCLPDGRVLSFDEKARRAIEQILKNYPLQPIVVPLESNRWTYIPRPETLIPYKGVDEFLSINPVCCKAIEYRDLEEGLPGFMERATGTVSGYIQIEHQLRFTENDAIKAVLVRNRPSISNCGRIAEGVDYRSSFQLFLGFNPADLFN